MFGTFNLGIEIGVENVIPDVDGIGEEEAAQQQHTSSIQYLNWRCLGSDGGMEQSKYMGEVNQEDPCWGKEASKLDIGVPGFWDDFNRGLVVSSILVCEFF